MRPAEVHGDNARGAKESDVPVRCDSVFAAEYSDDADHQICKQIRSHEFSLMDTNFVFWQDNRMYGSFVVAIRYDTKHERRY